MDKISVLEYSLDTDDVLNFVVKIPSGTYIKEFYLANSQDILDNKGVSVKNIYKDIDEDSYECFRRVFDLVYDTKDYAIYSLKKNFKHKEKQGIYLKRNELNFITLVLDDESITFPVYDSLCLKTNILRSFKLKERKVFMDCLLQLNAFELSAELKDFMFTSKLWHTITNFIEK